MIIDTRDFGRLEIDPKELIQFRSPIYGFERLTKFALLCDDTMDAPFTWLQSVEDKDVCFILVEPETVSGGTYAPLLPTDIREMLLLEPDSQPVYRVIAVIPAQFEEATVNLKSPIVINPVKKYAAQVILDADYPIRALLIAKQGGDASC